MKKSFLAFKMRNSHLLPCSSFNALLSLRSFSESMNTLMAKCHKNLNSHVGKSGNEGALDHIGLHVSHKKWHSPSHDLLNKYWNDAFTLEIWRGKWDDKLWVSCRCHIKFYEAFCLLNLSDFSVSNNSW